MDIGEAISRLESLLLRVEDNDKYDDDTAIRAGICALRLIGGKEDAERTAHRKGCGDTESSKKAVGGMGAETEKDSADSMGSADARRERGAVRILEKDGEMIADEIKAVLDVHKICWSDLRGMEQMNCELVGAILYGRDLYAAKNMPFVPLSCPSEGEFTAWKKGEYDDSEVLIKLTIPACAFRVSSVTHMARADRAWVERITSLDESKEYKEAASFRDPDFIYRVGEMVESKLSFDRHTDYAEGIHFFIDKNEALRY